MRGTTAVSGYATMAAIAGAAALAAAGCGKLPPARPVTPGIHPELAEHTKHFERRVYRVAGDVYAAVGFQLANTIMIEGPEGVILFDVGGSFDEGKAIEAEFRKITQKPVRAVIYSHSHPDHFTAVKAYVSDDDVRSGRIDVYAQETFAQNVANQGPLLGPILAVRSLYSFGAFLSPQDVEGMNGGIGPRVSDDAFARATFIAPTRTVRDRLKATIAGVRLELLHVPSETPDEMALYLPDTRVLLSADVIQGPTYPNLYTIRGTSFRDPVAWVKSIDLLRTYHAEHLVPSHGQPVSGAERVEEILRTYRDGIQFVHDQTVRYMNKGFTLDELVTVVRLPPHLDTFKPYLRQYYGTLKHAVREIYVGYLGWFEGDPVALDPTPLVEAARRRVVLMGGRDRVLAEAKRALDEGESQWAAELATDLIRVNHGDVAARLLKARAFRWLGYAQMNINWRNWYLVSAMELEGTLDPNRLGERLLTILTSPDMVAALPTRVLLESMAVRLKAEDTEDVHQTVAFKFPAANESYALEVRRGIAQLHDGIPAERDAVLSIRRSFLNQFAVGETGLLDAVASGSVTFEEGSVLDVIRFLGYFERPKPASIGLTLH